MATTNARSPLEEPELLEDELELLEDELELLEDELELELEEEELPEPEDDELPEGSVGLLPPPQPASATEANASVYQRENRFCCKFVMGVSRDRLLAIVVV
ncbi:hypothetical protein [Sorangium sp. So ce1335]|uniref:hypothetical protein n=1 Tax=Sorangium sp. So ce1335 TaxID=3133335 RepID=UPI003F5F5A98